MKQSPGMGLLPSKEGTGNRKTTGKGLCSRKRMNGLRGSDMIKMASAPVHIPRKGPGGRIRRAGGTVIPPAGTQRMRSIPSMV